MIASAKPLTQMALPRQRIALQAAPQQRAPRGPMYAPTFGFSGSCSSARATTQAVTPVPQLTTSGLPVSTPASRKVARSFSSSLYLPRASSDSRCGSA